MAAILKTIIYIWMILAAAAFVSAANPCITGPGGLGSIYSDLPYSGETLTVGDTPSAEWDGINRVTFQSSGINWIPSGSCLNVYARQIIDTDGDVFSKTYTTPQSGQFLSWGFGTGKIVTIGATWKWHSAMMPQGVGCGESTCITSVITFYTAGPSTPAGPAINTHSPSGTFATGTTSVNLACKGSCPDPAGCDVYYIDAGDDTISSTHVASCTGINCWSFPYTWNGLDAGLWFHECKVIDSYSQSDTDSRTFTINGTACPIINANFISPTPIHASTVQNETQRIKFTVTSLPSSIKDILLYDCEGGINTCTPLLDQSLASQSLSSSPLTYTFAIYDMTPGNYVRWYVLFDDGTCPTTKTSANGGNTAWYRINSTSASLNVTLNLPPNGQNISSGIPISFVYTTQAITANTTNKLYIDGALINTTQQPTGLNSITVSSISTGNHNWYVTAFDGSSTSQSGIFNFTILPVSPIITPLGPVDGYQFPAGSATTSSNPIRWQVTASTATIDKFYINGVLNQTFPATSNLIRTTNIPISGNTVYNWHINSTDTNSLSGTSTTWNFGINCTPNWVRITSACQPNGQKPVIYNDQNNCNEAPTGLSPANGTYEQCFYCQSDPECDLYGDCQLSNTQTCLQVSDHGILPCNNTIMPSPSTITRACVFSTGPNTVTFTSTDIVDINDPFNKGILPDLYNGIIAFFASPFGFWLIMIVAALTLLLTAIAILTWVKSQ